jgi:hypothetical protein
MILAKMMDARVKPAHDGSDFPRMTWPIYDTI